MPKRLAALLALLLLLLPISRARADVREEAKGHHEVAKTLFAQDKFKEALAEFQRAYELAPIPDLLYNIGLCHEKLGDTAAAIDNYDRYLAARPEAEERAALEPRLIELRRSMMALPPRVEPEVKPPVAPLAPQAPPPSAQASRWWLWTALAAVLVGAGVGVSVGLVSSTATTFPSATFTLTVGP